MLSEGNQARVTSVVAGETVSLESRFEKDQREIPGPVESSPSISGLTCLEICAGGGGQSLGLHQAGFAHRAAVEIDPHACETLRLNHPEWNIVERDIHHFDGTSYKGVDLLAGGVPCPPFSIAGKRLGEEDEWDLFPQALQLIGESGPRAVLLENVRGLGTRRFDDYRAQILHRLHQLGYDTWWDLVHASDHGVPQLRPRFVLVALRQPWASWFRRPQPQAGGASDGR
jgi:DNA (cytosine-5)-methyltransferase 1